MLSATKTFVCDDDEIVAINKFWTIAVLDILLNDKPVPPIITERGELVKELLQPPIITDWPPDVILPPYEPIITDS